MRLAGALLLACLPASARDYVPPRNDWAQQTPAEAGFDSERLAAAVAWAQANGEQAPADLRDALLDWFGPREPGYRILGPVGTRGAANGVILRGGRIVAEWGATPPPDTTAPTAAFTTPAAGGQVPVGPTTITGTASDNQSVAAVYVALRRNDNQQWLRPNGTWAAGFTWVPAAVTSPGTTATGWSLPVTLPVTGGYFTQVRVDDAAGNQNVNPKPGRSFSAVAASDAATPTGTIAAPANNASVTAPVTLSGSAADDTGVASVKLGIRQNGTNLWWNGTSWQSAAIKVNAVLGTPNGTTTTWTYSFSPPPGGYGFSTDVTDVAGKLAIGTGKPAWRSFTVVS